MGFTARPERIKANLRRGLSRTLSHYYSTPSQMELPYRIEKYRNQIRERFQELRAAPEEEKRSMRRELRQEGNQAYLDYGILWLMRARQEDLSPFEKLVMFLQDVFVVGLPKTRNPYHLFLHQAILRENARG